jgi:hypothetical protein
MTWDTERSVSGKRPWQWVEVAVDRCTLTYGESPCVAAINDTGSVKCLNSFVTCQDTDNFTPADFFFRFCEPVADMPRKFTFADDGLASFLPLLRSVSHAPGMPDPGETMGLRARLTVTLDDAPHHDRGVDKYVDERTFNPLDYGTFWRKMKARWPHYIGRTLRWYQGYLVDAPLAYVEHGASLDCDFSQESLTARYGGVTLTVTRAGNTGTRFNSSGDLEVINANLPRWDYDPSTGEQLGLKIEPGRTNAVRNNTMVNVVAGSPGTMPTNWSASSGGGVTRTIVGSGQENGINYIDIRFQGGAGNSAFIVWDTNITGTVGQIAASSFYHRLVGGSLDNITLGHNVSEYSSAPAFLVGSGQFFTPTGAALKTQRDEHTRTMTNASIATIRPSINLTATGAYDVTLRIGLPQCETGSGASSAIKTSGSAVARAVDSIGLANLTPWYRHGFGTVYLEYSAKAQASGIFPLVFSISDNTGTTDDIIAYINTGASNRAALRVRDGGVVQAEIAGLNAVTAGDTVKHVMSWKANAFTSRHDAGAEVSDAAGTIPDGVDRLWLLGITGTGSAISGHIKRFTYWPKVLDSDVRADLVENGPTYLETTENVTQVTDFRVREYVIERVTGPDASGKVTIIAKDVLKLLDDKRAQAPVKSTGTLNEVIADSGACGDLDVLTDDPTEYSLKGYDSVAYVRIGGEVFSYTGVSAISGGVTLTGCVRGAPSPYVTDMESHAVGDAVQLCRYFNGTVPDIIYELMVDYGGIDPAFIPLAEWQAEAETWLAGDEIRRLVTEPEGVTELINEIIGQTLTWGVWFEEIDQEIKFRAMRPADIGDEVATLTDDGNIVAGTVKLNDDPDSIRNEVQVLYGQIDPTGSKETVENYTKGLAQIDADSQSVNETGQKRIKRVFGRWWPATSSSSVLRYATRTLSARVKNLFTMQFELERKDEDIKTAHFADLTTIYLTDEFGVPRTTRVQLIRADASGERVKYTVVEDFFRVSSQFGRWAPARLDGVAWADADADDQARYIAWCDETTGQFSNGDDGKVWS